MSLKRMAGCVPCSAGLFVSVVLLREFPLRLTPYTLVRNARRHGERDVT